MNISKKRVVIGATVAALALGGTGVAYAYWTSTGSTTGSATTGTATAFTVHDDGNSGASLAPSNDFTGGPQQTVNFTVTNPGTGAQNVHQVTVSFKSGWSNTKTGSSAPACTAADFVLGSSTSIATATPGAAYTQTVDNNLAAGGSQAYSAKVQMIDTGLNQDNCQGVSVPLVFSAS